MSSAKDITREDWDTQSPFSLRERLLELEFAIRKRAKELFDTGEISFSDYEKITNYCQDILNFVAKINSLQFTQVLTDMEKPGKEISDATSSLTKAADKIQSFQNFFDILSLLTKLGGVILNAISGGSVATIGSLVTELKDLGTNTI